MPIASFLTLNHFLSVHSQEWDYWVKSVNILVKQVQREKHILYAWKVNYESEKYQLAGSESLPHLI